MQKEMEKFLRIGDYVTFTNGRFHGMLCAEGILVENVILRGDITTLDDALYCVHLQRQYSAARELEEFMTSEHEEDPNDAGLKTYRAALQKGRDNETKLNNNYMAKKMGEPVKFGDIIQLFHIKSGKYLTVSPTILANEERENMSVLLNSHGNIYSWLVVTPRFKIDRAGDLVQDASEMYLKVSERQNEFIHAAERVPVEGHNREVNCSLESTAWKMNIFQSASGAAEDLLLAAQLVYFTDPEIDASLFISEPEMDQLDPDTGPIAIPGDDDSDEDEDEDDLDEIYAHKYGDLKLKPADAAQKQSQTVDSRSLWVMEMRNMTHGGPIFWRNTQVKLKNVGRGCYLELVTKYEIDDDGDVVEKYMFSTTFDSSSPTAMWNVSEPNSTSKTLVNSKAYQISNNGIFFQRGDEQDDKSYIVRGSKDKDDALNLLIVRYEEEAGVSHSDGAADEGVSAEPLDVFAAMACRDYLRKYLDMIVIPTNATISTLWPSADGSDMQTLQMVIERSVNFSQGFAISKQNVVIGVDKASPAKRTSRQVLFREQNILDHLLSIIFKLKPISLKVEKAQNNTKAKAATFTDEEKACIDMGNLILGLTFRLLYYCILDNPQNQIYVADNLPVLLAHLGNQPLAGKCVTEMLSKNQELQETKVTTREIAIFVGKLRSSKMNPMYLQLLQACCSCEGKGVDSNQCKVVDMIFDNTNDIVIQINADYTKLQPVQWQSSMSHLYIPDAPISGSPIKGEGLLYNGLPALALAWTTNSIDFSPLGLFGKLSVNVQELYGDIQGVKGAMGSGSGGGSTSNKAEKFRSSNSTQRNAVAGYFISQMYLAAEMCMDRNYVAMHRLDDMFPFNVLLTVLKIEVSDDLKAAAARLLLCLHVDRDPQAGTKVPVLTRTWAEIIKHDTPKLPYVEPQRQYMFCLLQQILSEHVEGMVDRRWNVLSQRMLHLLKVMVEFNFYGTLDRMNDVIRPLIKALDRRKMLFGGEGAATTTASGGGGGGGGSASAKAKPQSSKGGSKSSKVVPVEGDAGSSSKYALDASQGEEMKEGDADDMGDGGLVFDEEQESKLASDTWYGRTFEFMEGIPFLLFILALVVLAVTLTVLSTTGTVSDSDGSPSYYIGLVIFVIFVVDLLLRLYCYYRIHGRVDGFVKNTFNQIDFVVVAIDVVFLALPTDGGGGSSAQYTKILRLVRMVRLLRILRAARVINALAEEFTQSDKGSFSEPRRYTKAPDYELETMDEMVNILLYSEKVTQDRNLSLFLRQFYSWEVEDIADAPKAIFFDVVARSGDLTIATDDFENIFLDVLMFKHTALTQGALDALMLRFSSQKTLLENARTTQLLIAPKRERQFRLVDQMLQQLERNAETHELWGELDSDADHNVNKQTKDILVELAEMCRSVSFVYDSRGKHQPEREVQDLLRNLGCYGICMKVLELFEGIEEEDEETPGELGEVGENTKDLCRLCNTLLYWSILDNPKNQEQAYDSLAFFMASLDQGIGSDLCVRAVFSNNEYLMKLVPHIHLEELVDKIVQGGVAGKRAEYLSLAVSITNVGDRNVVENQFEIVRTLTKPGRLQKCGSFLVPVNHPEYARKMALMEGLDVNRDYERHELPTELGYHLMLMEVLAGCTAGRLNVSSIEAKIQSVFSYIDVIETILDPRMVLTAKTETMRFLFNAIIEVDLVVPGLGHSKCCWRLITSFIALLGSLKDDLLRIDAKGWDAAGISRQKLEYQQLAISILAIFFEKNYNINMFTNEAGNTDEQLDKVSMTSSQATNIIKTLYGILRAIHQLNSPRLGDESKDFVRRACLAMNNSVHNKIESAEANGEYVPLEAIIEQEEAAWAKQKAIDSGDSDLSLEKRVHRKYEAFLKELEEDEEVQASAEDEVKAFVATLESLPYTKDDVDGDIRYELLIKKLVTHVRENIQIIDGETRLPTRCSRTTLWVFKIFRTMIENKMGMSIFDRDEDGGEEEDAAAEPVVTAFNRNGVTELCLDLIADGVDDELQDEAIKLAVGLLYKEGGSRSVQALMNAHLARPEAHLFWNQAKNIINKLKDWHEWHVDPMPEVAEGEDPDIPVSLLLVRMLQLMSEGHYHDNQEIVREQPNSPAPVNILEDLVNYLKALSQIPCRTSVVAALRVANTILEVLQGPCKKNQEYLAMSTDLLEVINRVIRMIKSHDIDVDELVELKITVIDIIEGILEAQSLKSQLYERVLSVLHVDAIVGIAFPNEEEQEDEQLKESENWGSLQIECVVILQMLIEYHPPLREELSIPEDVTDGTTTASVEILWDGEMNRVFFHIPDVCSLLSKPSKDGLVESVERGSQETKLLDFLDRAAVLYREVKHQEKIVAWGLAAIFSRENQNYMTWAAFGLAMTQNMLFLGYYDRQHAGDVIADDYWVLESTGPVMPDHIVVVVNVLNYLQIFCATFINVMMFVVRSPVIFQTYSESQDDYSLLECCLYTIADPTTMYYIGYNVIAVLGLTVEDYYSTLLLLDIVMKNSTAQNVLMAVVVPRWNIIMALIVTAFTCYIFGFYVFIYFPTEDFDALYVCQDLWGCTKFLVDYGILMGEGIGEAMLHTVGQRWLLDTLAFFAITTGIFNLVAGVIITTFTALREAKEERLDNTTGVCFICGIEKHVFDRAANDPDGFKFHISEDHNMWNYLNFIFFIWEQDKDDDDGLEYFVRYAIEASNIDWMPTNKAMRLDQAASEEEAIQEDLKKATEESFANVAKYISKVEANVGVVLEQLTQTLKKDHHVEDEDGLGATTSASAAGNRARTGSRMPGEVSAPSSAWNAYRRKTAPYQRPETSGILIPDGPSEDGSLASLKEHGVGQEDGQGPGDELGSMFSGALDGGDGDDMSMRSAGNIPGVFAGRSSHGAIRKIFVSLVRCTGLPFLDNTNHSGAQLRIVGTKQGTTPGPRGGAFVMGGDGESKGGDMDATDTPSLAWHDDILYFDSTEKVLVYQHLGGEHFDGSDTVRIQLVVDGAASGEPVTVTLDHLIATDDLATEYSFPLAGGEETATLLLTSSCLSYVDDTDIAL